MLYGEIMAVCHESHMVYKNTLCGQNAKLALSLVV
jgi:hypothetical protein